MKTTNELKRKLIDYLDGVELEKLSAADVLSYAQTVHTLNDMERMEYMNMLNEKMINNIYSGFNGGDVTGEAKTDG